MAPMRWTLALLVIALSALSCNLSGPNDPIIVSQVEREFRLFIWEELGPSGGNFQLRVETLEPAPCRNTTIAIQSRQIGQSLRLSLQDIVEPANCEPGAEPARATASYGNLAPGFYELLVDLKETVTNEGRLLVFGDRYEFNLGTDKGLELGPRVLRRVPEGIVWGYFSADDRGADPEYAAFIAGIDPFVRTSSLVPGQYGHFELKQNGRDLEVTDVPDAPYLKTFLYRFDGEDPSQLATRLEELRAQLPEGMQFEVRTWTGQSW